MGYVASNEIGSWTLMMSTEGGNCDLCEGNTSGFAWRYWGKPRKSWLPGSRYPVEIPARYLSSTN